MTDEELGTIKKVGDQYEAQLERLIDHDQQAVWSMLTEK